MDKIIKRYAVVENGLVTNLVLADEEHAYKRGYVLLPEKTIIEPEPPNVSIGWEWTGFRFQPPPRNIEAEWEGVRVKAFQLLANSDRYILPDLWSTYTTEQQQMWANYRQELRSLESKFDDPANVVWPEMPKVD